MPTTAFGLSRSEAEDPSGVHCDACRSVLRSESDRSVSFLLVDELAIPVLGCEEHLRQFAAVCGLSTDDSADLLEHYPAGGIRCPGCRNARHDPSHPVIAVQDGAVVVVACPDHEAAIVDRFRTGLQTREQLNASLGTATTRTPR